MPRQDRRQPKPAPTPRQPEPAPTPREPEPAPMPREPEPAPMPRQPKPALMPRQPKPARTPRQPKPACTPRQPEPAASCQLRPWIKAASSSPINETTSIDYNALKRSELQRCCKELGLRATGKNAELVERLQDYHLKPLLKMPRIVEETAEKTEKHHPTSERPLTVLHTNLLEVKSDPVEVKTEVIQGWCVVHGMSLYRPPSSWAPLLLRRGQVCVRDGENVIPFHLRPLNSPVPDGLCDNYICGDCVIRTSQGRKLYRPQEDRAYAQRVDGILFQMAHGELGMDQVLHPLQPRVVHSPAPFNQ